MLVKYLRGKNEVIFSLHNMYQNKLQIVKRDKGITKNDKQSEVMQMPSDLNIINTT